MIIKDGEYADIPTPTGPMRLHLFRPAAAGRYPSILLYSEIYQITGPIRRMAAFLAGQGYLVAAPEVYHEFEKPGTVLAYDPAGTDRGNDLKFTKEVSAFDSDARAGLDFMAQHECCTGQLGVMGICLGGHLAFRAAMNRDVLAAACFYATDIHDHQLGKRPQTRSKLPEVEPMRWSCFAEHRDSGMNPCFSVLSASQTDFEAGPPSLPDATPAGDDGPER
jgi:carboxymethylenebutenolidase